MAIDDNTTYGLTGAQVKELPERINAVKGLARVLTADDYNYPTDNPTSIAPWLLEDGVYTKSAGIAMRISASGSFNSSHQFTFVLGHVGNDRIMLRLCNSAENTNNIEYFWIAGTGSMHFDRSLLNREDVVNSLTSTSGSYPLSAAQGKVLKDLVDSLAIRGAGAPTTSTVGQVGTLYEDTTNGDLYICTDATNPYVWEEVGAGGGGGGIVELTSADYNYHRTGSPDDGIAPWLLDPGVYVTDRSNTIAVYHNKTLAAGYNAGSVLVITRDGSSTTLLSIRSGGYDMYTVATSDGTMQSVKAILTSSDVLTTTGTNNSKPMSQNATTSMVYADPSTKYQIRLGAGSNPSGADAIAMGKNALVSGSYAIGIGTNVNQRTTASSANAIAIGADSQATNTGAIALGRSASASALGSIAIGQYSSASTQGEMNIGTTSTSIGYNSTNYRLLTGVHDPQNAHDAATKGYVDGMITMTDTDPGEGAALAAGKFIAVYDSNS